MISTREGSRSSTTAARSSYASALWVMAGLSAGVLLGILASASASPLLFALVRFVEPLGAIFVNAIRMPCPAGGRQPDRRHRFDHRERSLTGLASADLLFLPACDIGGVLALLLLRLSSPARLDPSCG